MKSVAVLDPENHEQLERSLSQPRERQVAALHALMEGGNISVDDELFSIVRDVRRLNANHRSLLRVLVNQMLQAQSLSPTAPKAELAPKPNPRPKLRAVSESALDNAKDEVEAFLGGFAGLHAGSIRKSLAVMRQYVEHREAACEARLASREDGLMREVKGRAR